MRTPMSWLSQPGAGYLANLQLAWLRRRPARTVTGDANTNFTLHLAACRRHGRRRRQRGTRGGVGHQQSQSSSPRQTLRHALAQTSSGPTALRAQQHHDAGAHHRGNGTEPPATRIIGRDGKVRHHADGERQRLHRQRRRSRSRHRRSVGAYTWRRARRCSTTTANRASRAATA
jgi:hypothetical protein